jgi:protein O-mannosyl-transferase
MAEKRENKGGAPEVWTVAGLLDHFLHIDRKMENRSFAFVLGAGASRPSSIPTGGELVRGWLEELRQRLDHEEQAATLDDWATPENLGIGDFDFSRAAEFYPAVYRRRFRGDAEEGFAYLESIIEGTDPSFGYSVLAQILVTTRHRVVVTTNFDNLVADAVMTYTKRHPLVCGHESLAQFARVKMRRPLVVKIHRDLLLSPFSDPAEVDKLAAGWDEALGALFGSYSPIFIGYGGNDGSLMNFLESLQPGEIEGRLIWCYRIQGEMPNERICALVRRHNGALVPILGFDEFMLQLGERLGFGLLGDNIERQAKERAANYQSQVEEIKGRLGQLSGPKKAAALAVESALSATVQREVGSSQWLFNALLATDPEERERLYEEGLREFPNHLGLLLSYARCAAGELNKYEKAGKLFESALELFPEDESTLISAAEFYAFSLAEYDRAKKLLEHALKLNPEQSVATSDLGLITLYEGNVNEAELLFQRALDLSPKNARAMSNLAIILSYHRGRHEDAEQLFRKSVELEPADAALLTNLSLFLFERGRVEEAEEYAALAWDLPYKEVGRATARLAFLRAATARLGGLDDAEALGHLKYILLHGFPRAAGRQRFEGSLRVLDENLPPEASAFYKALAGAILSGDEVNKLNSFDSWKSVAPRALAG